MKLVDAARRVARGPLAALGRPGARADGDRAACRSGWRAARRGRSAAGCVYTRRPRTVYLRPGLRDPRGVLLHELGHVYDLKVMNNRDRGVFRRIMRRGSAKWWRGAEPLAEQFAEAYSWCARYARIVSIARYSSYDYRPDRPPAPGDLRGSCAPRPATAARPSRRPTCRS